MYGTNSLYRYVLRTNRTSSGTLWIVVRTINSTVRTISSTVHMYSQYSNSTSTLHNAAVRQNVLQDAAVWLMNPSAALQNMTAALQNMTAALQNMTAALQNITAAAATIVTSIYIHRWMHVHVLLLLLAIMNSIRWLIYTTGSTVNISNITSTTAGCTAGSIYLYKIYMFFVQVYCNRWVRKRHTGPDWVSDPPRLRVL